MAKCIEVKVEISEEKILEALDRALRKIKAGYKPGESDTSITAWVYNHIEIIPDNKNEIKNDA